MNNYSSGLFAEFLARWFLRLRGFRILESRYITGKKTGRAEIDIIACRGSLLIFVEVKKRANVSAAFEAIIPAQRVRLRRAAATYLAQRKWQGNARFDVIVVAGRRIRWAKGVF